MGAHVRRLANQAFRIKHRQLSLCPSSSTFPPPELKNRQGWPSLSPSPFRLDQRMIVEPARSFVSAVYCNLAVFRRLHTKRISHLISGSSHGSKKVYLLDTLALVRRLEVQGWTTKQAEAITSVVTEVLNSSLENASQLFVTKAEMQRSEMIQEASLSKLKGDIQIAQELKVSSLQQETNKLRTDIDKMRSEIRYEIDKVTAGQRLDLNLERGRMREDLANQNEETSDLTNMLDKEIHTLKTQLEAAKYEVIKYCIGSIVSLTALGLGLLRIIM